MKKCKLLFNVLFCCTFILSLVSFALMIKLCNNCYSNYKMISEIPFADTSDSLSLFLQTFFAVIFSGLSAIASAVTAVIFNLPAFKAKKLSQTEKPDND